MSHEKFMREALALARQAGEEGEVPVGCVVVWDGEVIGRGRNRREKSRSALAHAEIEAIGEACRNLGGWRLWKATLYVTLEPCPMCAGAILNARIAEVRYGVRDEKYGACGSVVNLFAERFPHRPRLYGGLLSDECATVLRDFFRGLRSGAEEESGNLSSKNRRT